MAIAAIPGVLCGGRLYVLGRFVVLQSAADDECGGELYVLRRFVVRQSASDDEKHVSVTPL